MTVGVVHYSLFCANDCDFAVLFIISVYVVLSWCAAYRCLNAYVKRKPGWLFSVSEAPDAASRVHVDLPTCNGPLVV